MGRSWRVDETSIKIKGEWVYLYRAVDKAGQTVDFYLSAHRDVAAAKKFFKRAIFHRGTPEKITLDGYTVSHRAVNELKEEDLLPDGMELRSNQYLNNIIEQDHRRVKLRTGPMLGFKIFENAAIVITGIELAQQIRKGQFHASRIMKGLSMPNDLWLAMLGV